MPTRGGTQVPGTSRHGWPGVPRYLTGRYDVRLEVMAMVRPVEVKARPRFHIWVRYDDGVEGEVDLSDLAGHGVFTAWNDRKLFEGVRLGAHGAIEWGDQLDLCPDAIYLRLTGKSPEDLFPALKRIGADA